MVTDIDWTGTWETNFGKVELLQKGNIVTGSYGIKQGRIDGLALDDRLSGKWSEAPSYAPPNDAGKFVICMDQSAKSFRDMNRFGPLNRLIVVAVSEATFIIIRNVQS